LYRKFAQRLRALFFPEQLKQQNSPTVGYDGSGQNRGRPASTLCTPCVSTPLPWASPFGTLAAALRRWMLSVAVFHRDINVFMDWIASETDIQAILTPSLLIFQCGSCMAKLDFGHFPDLTILASN